MSNFLCPSVDTGWIGPILSMDSILAGWVAVGLEFACGLACDFPESPAELVRLSVRFSLRTVSSGNVLCFAMLINVEIGAWFRATFYQAKVCVRVSVSMMFALAVRMCGFVLCMVVVLMCAFGLTVDGLFLRSGGLCGCCIFRMFCSGCGGCASVARFE